MFRHSFENDDNLFAFTTYEQLPNQEEVIIFKRIVAGSGETIEEEVPVILSMIRIGLFPDGNNEFEFETEMMVLDVDLSTLSQLLIYLAQLEQKGSILVNSYTYNPKGDSTINFTIIMTAGGEMRNYSAIIGECPNCGTPYYYADAANGDYVCGNCNTPIAAPDAN
ncbi:MAG: TFIIB-type zinc ribbon-containing protein [Clostridia bacterium]|nr:TFIIB-type zinc ribbon-containing protein [Clostridia bacterium]